MSKNSERLRGANALNRNVINHEGIDNIYSDVMSDIEALGQSLQLARGTNGVVTDFRFGNVEMNRTGLTFTSQYTFDDWCDIGQVLDTVNSSLNWWLGDWLNACIPAWRDDAMRFISQYTGFNYDTLCQYERVCRAIPHEVRRPALSYSHHLQVSNLEDEVRNAHLQHADMHGMSVREFKRYLASLSERSESPFKQVIIDLGFGERQKEMRAMSRKVDNAIGGNRKDIHEVKGWIVSMRTWLDEIDKALQ